jgi:hypothetical protein
VNFLQQQLPGVPISSDQQLTRDKLRRLRKKLVEKVGEEHIADVNVLDEPVNIVMEKFTGSAKDFVRACAKDAKAIALAAEDIRRLFKKATAFQINCIDQKLQNFLVKWHKDPSSGACTLKEGDVVFTDFDVGWCCDNLRHFGAAPISDCRSSHPSSFHDDGDPTDVARQVTRNLLMILQTAASSPQSQELMTQFCPEVSLLANMALRPRGPSSAAWSSRVSDAVAGMSELADYRTMLPHYLSDSWGMEKKWDWKSWESWGLGSNTPTKKLHPLLGRKPKNWLETVIFAYWNNIFAVDRGVDCSQESQHIFGNHSQADLLFKKWIEDLRLMERELNVKPVAKPPHCIEFADG